MLIQLLSEQVSENWDVIGSMIEASLPPLTAPPEITMANVLESVLLGKSSVWGYMNEDEKLTGIVLTTIYEEPISKVPYLLVYSVYLAESASRSEWTAGIETLRDFADGLGCAGLVAYTSSRSIARKVRQIGGKADFMLLEF